MEPGRAAGRVAVAGTVVVAVAVTPLVLRRTETDTGYGLPHLIVVVVSICSFCNS